MAVPFDIAVALRWRRGRMHRHTHVSITTGEVRIWLMSCHKHARDQCGMVRGPESVGQAASRIGPNQQCFQRNYIAVC